jgi:hypothetical protein
MAQWWACDKGCGFFSANFDEVTAHEQYCQHTLQTANLISPPQVRNAPSAPQHIVPAFVKPIPQVDLLKSITTMEDYIRRQQVDLAKLWDENQALRQYLQALSLKCCHQESEIYALKSGASQSSPTRRPVETQRVVPGNSAVSGRSDGRTLDTVNHLWI